MSQRTCAASEMADELEKTRTAADRYPDLHDQQHSHKTEALVKYSFVGEGEQELRLTPGDIITDVRPLTAKPGWSKGTLRGERVHFPDSLVELHVTELYNEEVHVFLSQPSEWLYCRSCHQLLVEAQEMSCCEGLFCLKCIEQWKDLGKNHCPGCTTSGWSWHANRTVERMLKGLHVLCRNHSKGCQWRGELRGHNEHLTKDTGCQFAIVRCPHNCGTDDMRSSLNDHVTTQCHLRPFHCQYCQTMSTYTDIINNHLPECPMHPVTCPNNCEAEGVVRQSLTVHLNSCPLQSIDCSNGCGVQVLRKGLEGHIEDDCLLRKIPCEYCEAVDTFKEITGKHRNVCSHFPLHCPNKCSDQKILRQDLPDHIEKSCPLHTVRCEFAHVGCTAQFCRKDRADHMTHSQAAHLSLVMAHLVLHERKYDELQSSHELLKEKYATLECENEAQQRVCRGSIKELKRDFETLRLRSLRAHQRELELAARLPPPSEGLPRVFCVEKCIDIPHWSSSTIHIYNVELTFNVYFQKLYPVLSKKVTVSLEGNVENTECASSTSFNISFELLHPENEIDNVPVCFVVHVQHPQVSATDSPEYTVSCSPQQSTLIANTTHFNWERYMIGHSLCFKVTATK